MWLPFIPSHAVPLLNTYFGITLRTQCVLIEYIYDVCEVKWPTALIKCKYCTPFWTAIRTVGQHIVLRLT